jgi:hypothetical protein
MKLLGREIDWHRLPGEMTRAIRSELESMLDPTWVASLKRELQNAAAGLFALEQCNLVLQTYAAKCPSLAERQLCEMARGLLARDGVTEKLVERAYVEVCKSHGPPNIEQISSKVAERFGPEESAKVSIKLTEVLSRCCFEPPMHENVEQQTLCDLEILDQPISLRLE